MLAIQLATTALSPLESVATNEPQERWIYTTKGHLHWYGILALAPIFRDQIRSVLLDSERVYLAVLRARSRFLFVLGSEVQFLAMNRHDGQTAWQRPLPFNGYPIGGQFVLVGGRLVAALSEEQTKEIVVLALDRTDGSVVWRTNLPGAKGPTLVGDEARVDVDPSREAVIINILGSDQRHQFILNAHDGSKVAQATYRGYTWRFGTRRAAGLNLGYEGMPTGLSWRKYERVLAFHESTGQLAWTLPLLPKGASPPAVFEDSMLIANGDRLLRIDLRSGRFRWEVNVGGRIADDGDPPAVIGPRVAVSHTATPNPEDNQWKLTILRLADGSVENEIALGELNFARVLRRMADLIIVGSYSVLQVIDPERARIVATLDFKKLFSWFVYSNLPDMRVGDSDGQGLVVVTRDGRLWYFAAEDFRGLGEPPLSRRRLAEEPRSVMQALPAPVFYLVVNPLWNALRPNRFFFWLLFYTFPFGLLLLVGVWKPLGAWLGQRGMARAAGWGALIGGFLALPAAVYLGLVGGMAAGFGVYGPFGPIWGGVVGFGYFLGIGAGLGAIVGSVLSLLPRR